MHVFKKIQLRNKAIKLVQNTSYREIWYLRNATSAQRLDRATKKTHKIHAFSYFSPMNKETSFADFLKGENSIQLNSVLEAIADATAAIHQKVAYAGLNDSTGTAGSTNVQGEEVQKLDLIANDIIVAHLQKTAGCAAVVSEETDGVLPLDNDGEYVVAVDPLDGSSNIDIAAPIGTIFAIWKRTTTGTANDKDFMQKGNAVAAAGYVLFGSSTILVLSTGKGTNGFTLDASGKYQLSHPAISIKKEGKIYSVNQGNASKFDEGLQSFIAWCTQTDKATSRPYSLRYIGSMVGDLHRTLLKGGIFFYPANKGETKGKLRLLYECIPMAYLVTQAGGAASDGNQSILDLQPTEIHERTAIFIGSENTVNTCLKFLKTEVLA